MRRASFAFLPIAIPHNSIGSFPLASVTGACLSLLALGTLTGCASARFAELNAPPSRGRVQTSPAVKPSPAERSALGRPPHPSTESYDWNGASNRTVEGRTPAIGTYPTATLRTATPLPQPLYDQRTAALAPPAPVVPFTPSVTAPRGMIVVAPGDTLYGLSRRHGVSISALMEANSLRSLSLQPGQALKLPPGARSRG